MQASLTAHLLKHKFFLRSKYTPLVLMLEPLHACNLTCEGCGRIIEYKDTITDQLPLEECLASADECGAPVVSICGGEPTLYRHINELINGLVEKDKYIYLCTNAMFLDKVYKGVPPSQNLFINVHLDGLRETHDTIVQRKGVFDIAVAQIKKAKKLGYQVTTNTTVYKQTSWKELDELFTYLTDLGIDGIIVAPGYSYEALGSSDDQHIFHSRAEVHAKFQELLPKLSRYRMFSTPQYIDFLAGERDYDCAPYANLTRNPRGWKGPCYAITNGHYSSYRELMESTDWEYYSKRKDPRCANCFMHSGFEGSVVLNMTGKDMIDMAKWQMSKTG